MCFSLNKNRKLKVKLWWVGARKTTQYTEHWDKTQIIEKFPSGIINGTKNVLLFLLRAPAHNNLTFNFQFSYELKHKVCLCKTVCGISVFDSIYFFLKFIFFSSKCMGSLTLKHHNSFQNKIIENHTQFCSQTYDF